LVGTPYLYASSDPAKGFRLFRIYYLCVYHFGIAVPRSSADFTDMGIEIPTDFVSPVIVFLFTGTDSTVRIVGHMGIVEAMKEATCFSTFYFRKAYGVVISPLKGYYEARFVKVIRVFPQTYFTTP
jgi:hypothetical protein